MGAQTVLSEHIGSALDSPVLHAWIYSETSEEGGNTITKIVIVGQGLPEIRAQIVPIALATALQVQAGSTDMINVDLLNIAWAENPHDEFPLPIPVAGRASGLEERGDIQEAMLGLQELLERLKRETGMVQVHYV